MRLTLLLLTSAVLTIAQPHAAGNPQGKQEEAKAVILTVTNLERIAARQTSQYPTGDTALQIDRLLDQMNSLEQLTRLALISHSIAWPQSAGDVAFDSVFDYTMWQCARRIARQPGPEPAASLQRLQSTLGSDGGGSAIMKELISSQEKIDNKP